MTDMAYALGGVRYLNSSADGVPGTFGGDRRPAAPNVQIVRVYFNPQGQNTYTPGSQIQFIITGGPGMGYYRSGSGFIEGVLQFKLTADIDLCPVVPELNYPISFGTQVNFHTDPFEAKTGKGFLQAQVQSVNLDKPYNHSWAGTVLGDLNHCPRRAAYLFWRYPGWQTSSLRFQQQLDFNGNVCYNQQRPDIVLALRMAGASISDDYRSIVKYLGPGIFTGCPKLHQTYLAATLNEAKTLITNGGVPADWQTDPAQSSGQGTSGTYATMTTGSQYELSARRLTEHDLISYTPGVISVYSCTATLRGVSTAHLGTIPLHGTNFPTLTDGKENQAYNFTNIPEWKLHAKDPSNQTLTYSVPFIWFTECPILDNKNHHLPLFMLGNVQFRIWLRQDPYPLGLVYRPRVPCGAFSIENPLSTELAKGPPDMGFALLDDVPPRVIALNNASWTVSDLRFNYESIRVGTDYEGQYMQMLATSQATHNIPFVDYTVQQGGIIPNFQFNSNGSSGMGSGTTQVYVNLSAGSVSGVCTTLEQKPGNPYPHFFSLRGLSYANIQVDGVNILQNPITSGQYERLYIEARKFWDNIIDRQRQPALTMTEWLMTAGCLAIGLEKVNEEDMSNRGIPVARTVRFDLTFQDAKSGGGMYSSSVGSTKYIRTHGSTGTVQDAVQDQSVPGTISSTSCYTSKTVVQGPFIPPTSDGVGGISEEPWAEEAQRTAGTTVELTPATAIWPKTGGVDQELHFVIKVNKVLSINAQGQFVVGA